MKLPYDNTDPKSIETYAKKLIGKNLNEILPKDKEFDFSKGRFGQLIEEYHFLYKPNSNPSPDFEEAGVELKTSSLKNIKKREIRAKERIVLNIINYEKIIDEKFVTSSFLFKNKLLLLIFYLHEPKISFLEFVIKIANLWEYPDKDLKIIEHDWNKIVNKIKDGKAHELSERDTFILGACTKGADKTTVREQPFSKTKAKQRAFSLKTKYVNYIIKKLNGEKDTDIDSIIKDASELIEEKDFETLVENKFEPFIGKSIEDIHTKVGSSLKKGTKGYYSQLARRILGVNKKRIEEFEKADVEMKTIRLKKSGLPKESMSFPTFKYNELVKEKWESSQFKQKLDRKFFFVIYQYDKDEKLRLKKVMFWSISNKDFKEVKKVWQKTKRQIKNHEAENLPRISENSVCHVRPHAKNGSDTYPTPQGEEMVKKCFWLNAKYIQKQIS